MVMERLQRKLEELRQQPEEVRLRLAIRYTIIIGVGIGILWLAALLPFQLRGIFSEKSPTVTPSVISESAH